MEWTYLQHTLDKGMDLCGELAALYLLFVLQLAKISNLKCNSRLIIYPEYQLYF